MVRQLPCSTPFSVIAMHPSVLTLIRSVAAPRSGVSRWGLALGGAVVVFSCTLTPAQAAIQAISFENLINLSICADQGLECNLHYVTREDKGLGPYDEIQYQVSRPDDLEPDEIELGFRSVLDWAKEVRIVDAQGRQIVTLETEDRDSRLRRTRLRAAELEGAKLVFVKGRMFGVRRPTFELPLTEETLAQLAGRRLTLTWVRD